jgi:ribonuclease P protein component
MGQSVFSPILLIKFVKNDLAFSRFGFIVSNKVSKKATKRNLVKRRINEIIRLNFKKIKIGFDIVIIVSPKIINQQGKPLAAQEINRFLNVAFQKAKLIV